MAGDPGPVGGRTRPDRLIFGPCGIVLVRSAFDRRLLCLPCEDSPMFATRSSIFPGVIAAFLATDVDLNVLRFTWSEELTMLARIGIAAIGGAVIGFERRTAGKSAGMRTLMLVSMGAALFTLVSIFGFEHHDQSRVASGIVAGIGFLGAGAILRDGRVVKGLTTAASIWVAAAVGAAAGSGLYIVAVGTALLSVIVMALWPHDVPGDNGDAEDEDPGILSR